MMTSDIPCVETDATEAGEQLGAWASLDAAKVCHLPRTPRYECDSGQ